MMPDCLIATNEMANFQEMMFAIQRILKKQLNTRLRKFAPFYDTCDPSHPGPTPLPLNK